MEKQQADQLRIENEIKRLKLQQDEDELLNLEQALEEIPDGRKASRSGRASNVGQSRTPGICDNSLADIIKTQNEISLSILKSQQRSFLPKHVPGAFNGSDVTMYRPFKLAFQRMIEEYCSDDSSKYYYLLQYTDGSARQLVRSCQSLESSVAYSRAIKLLHDKYGNSALTADIFDEISCLAWDL